MDDADAKEFGKRTWKTREGEALLLSQMTTRHIRNVAHFIIRNYDEQLHAAWQLSYMVHGEIASDVADQMITSMDHDRQEAKAFCNLMLEYADWRESKGLTRGKSYD